MLVQLHSFSKLKDDLSKTGTLVTICSVKGVNETITKREFSSKHLFNPYSIGLKM